MSIRAVVLYDFEGEPQNNELIVSENDRLTVVCEVRIFSYNIIMLI